MAKKDEAIHLFSNFSKIIQNEKEGTIACIRSDHVGEFENLNFENFCDEHGIEHQFSSPSTPRQNVVVERKNISIWEITRTMLHENDIP